jgi:DNA-directed RNA polymerase beta' subunit
MNKQYIIDTLNRVQNEMQELKVITSIIANTSITDIKDEDLHFIISSINLDDNLLWTNIIKSSLLGEEDEQEAEEVQEQQDEDSEKVETEETEESEWGVGGDQLEEDEDQETEEAEFKEEQLRPPRPNPFAKPVNNTVLEDAMKKIRSK